MYVESSRSQHLLVVCKLRPMHKHPTKVNGTRVGVMDGLKTDDNSPSAAPRTFINQLPDWSMLLAAITTIFLAAEKQWMMLVLKKMDDA